jgi:hypothetical protein
MQQDRREVLLELGQLWNRFTQFRQHARFKQRLEDGPVHLRSRGTSC